MLGRLGAEARAVRRPNDLDGLDALVLPGGESTTMSMLLDSSGLRPGVQALIERGLPVLGTCAGLILLSARVEGARPDQSGFGGLDCTTVRNAYGRQNESFETEVDLGGGASIHGIFIRAPRIVETGPGVEVIGRVGDEPVLVKQGAIVGCAFHPELGDDPRVHALLIDEIGRSLTSVSDASQED